MKPSPCDYLVFDISNILYRTFFAHKTEDGETIAGMAAHSALVTVNKYFKAFKPRKKLIMCFDRRSWRKDYTDSEECITVKKYKGNRRQKMTPSEKQKYADFMDHLAEFETLVRDHTAIIALAADQLEADDLIAGSVNVINTKEDNVDIVVVSGDKDMIQLLKHDNVQLVDPATGKQRTLDEWGGDAELFMFEKCLRGDAGDNVMSALPRVRKTRIMKAYTNEYERANMMMETWSDMDSNEFTVKMVFNENRLLMDLEHQPIDIQKRIVSTVLEGIENPGTFSYFHFMKFLGKYELKKVAQQAEQFVPMFDH